MTRDKSRPNVIAFIQPFVPSYRRGLFDAIARRLEQEGLELEVWHAQPKGIVASRRNSVSGPWSVPITQHRLSFKRRNITYRPVFRDAKRVKAVVTGLASSSLETYRLAADRNINMMLWGHGRNYTAGNNAVDARLEGWLCERATHVFTYTEQGAEHLMEAGVPKEKLSTVVNTTDTVRLREGKEGASAADLDGFRDRLGIGPAAEVALFVGAFDVPKRLPFLFEAADLVRAARPDFVLVLAGAGPLDDLVAEEAAKRDYVRLAGRLEIDELAVVSNLVDLILIPGRVGLVAVDSLALGVPLVTTDYPFHAPEAEYLDRENSVWTANDASSYASGITEILNDPSKLEALKARAAADGLRYSAEQSAENFVTGILAGLELHEARTAPKRARAVQGTTGE
ncbi:glycosyltransferase family 4 protein [Herbiconiux sp. P15]|uniref:glycosyltransferase family 4 protein n=1 Tax=Herbiconiux liukaitaii TaxID=3342799 RepID=UPI0035BB12AC